MSGTANIVALLVTPAGWVGGAPCREAHALLEPEVERCRRELGCRCRAVPWGSARSLFCKEPVLWVLWGQFWAWAPLSAPFSPSQGQLCPARRQRGASSAFAHPLLRPCC